MIKQDRGATMSGLQALTLGKPLAVILNSSGQDSVTPGEAFSLSITVRNQGNRSAVIDVWVDPVSIAVQSWCEAPQVHLALGALVSEEVKLSFRVPIEALPGTYHYNIVIDAQADYPEDTPILFTQQIQVLPATHSIVRTIEPTFAVQPLTNSEQPEIVPSGGALPVQVLVHNRGDRVDRFRLTCSDLPKSWIRVTYPQGIQGTGLLTDTDSLNLNPGAQGMITLLITPPPNALAQTYIPTVRLLSENYPDLMLLDLVYLQVPPTYLLQIELRTLVNRIRRQPALFQVRLQNVGNTNRTLRLRLKDLDQSDCTYTIDAEIVPLAPNDRVGIDLQAKPEKWWKRPFYGGGRVLNFSVELEDAEQLPLPIDLLPGTVVWEARPWWQLLPFVLLGVLGVLSIAYLIWWLVFRTPPSPKIIDFSPEDSVYSAANGDAINLGWQIDAPERLQAIKLVGLAADGTQLTRPEVYDFSRGIPEQLKPFCVQQAVTLTCRNVRTSARKSGTYLFELTTVPKRGRGTIADTRKTNPIAITPIPQPKIIGFASTQPVYQEPSALPTKSDKPLAPPKNVSIRLNWSIVNPAQLGAVRIMGRSPDGAVVSSLNYDFSQGVPETLKNSCVVQQQLVCQNVPTELKKPGAYVFELTAVGKDEPSDKLEVLKTDVIKIQPKPPQILEFQLNGQSAKSAYLIPIAPGQDSPKFTLSWTIDASEGSKVELLPAPGSVPLKGNIPIVLNPKPGTTTIALQVTSPTGQQMVRSVTLETYDPTATDPAAAAAAAAASAIANAQKANSAPNGQAPDGVLPVPGAPLPTNPDSLSPIELPPQFDQR